MSDSRREGGVRRLSPSFIVRTPSLCSWEFIESRLASADTGVGAVSLGIVAVGTVRDSLPLIFLTGGRDIMAVRTGEFFSNRFTFMAAAIGMAVGTGNLWRFPASSASGAEGHSSLL